MKPHTVYRLILAITLAGITALSLVPVTGALDVNIWDKAQHAAAYTLLGVLSWAAGSHRNLPTRHGAMLFIYGVVIELIQGLLPWRSFSYLDMVANGVGIALATAFTTSASRSWRSLIKNSDPNHQ